MLNSENRRVGYAEVYYNYNTNKLFTEDFGNQFKELNISLSGGSGGSGLQSGDNISLLNNDAGYLTQAFYGNIPAVGSLPTTNLSFGDLCALNSDNRPYFYDGSSWRRLYLADAPAGTGDPDTDWDNVILRVPFNDNSANDVKQQIGPSTQTITFVGSPVKFGNSALKVQGSSSLTYSGGAIGTFLDSDFTLEFWFYPDSLPNLLTGIIDKSQTFFFMAFTGTSNQYQFKIAMAGAGNPVLQFPSNVSMPTGSWYHIAYCRNATSGNCQLFVNGVSYGTVSLNNVVDSTAYDFTISDNQNNQADYFIDDLRISSFERYTANFTPPTAELPTSGG